MPLVQYEIYQPFIPSKLFGSMAVGRAILLFVSGEARATLEEAEVGSYYSAEDGRALAEQILWLHDHPERMSGNGTAWASLCYDTMCARSAG